MAENEKSLGLHQRIPMDILLEALRAELNDEQVEAQAVDEIIQDLQRTDLVLQWILRYVMEQIDDNSSWNVVGSIKQATNSWDAAMLAVAVGALIGVVLCALLIPSEKRLAQQ